MTLLDAALRYASLGYQVFPLVPGTKRPLTSHGVHDATADAAQIRAWWTRTPTANIGLSTNGLLAVDVDGAGNPWLESDAGIHARLAGSPVQKTPSGGRHFLFRQPACGGWRNSQSAIAPRVDTRADGGYIVVAPSRLEDGREYSWAVGQELPALADLPEVPGWLNPDKAPKRAVRGAVDSALVRSAESCSRASDEPRYFGPVVVRVAAREVRS